MPLEYYKAMLDTWNNMNADSYNWDSNNAAAALLYAAVIDGIVHNHQITSQGHNAITWAASFLQKLDRLQSAA